jgi:hypothetical protein
LTSEIGSARAECAEGYIRAQIAVIALVAGRTCERILYPDLSPLPTEHDFVEARAFAGVACASPNAAGALLTYAEAEAAELIRQNRRDRLAGEGG